MNRSAVFHRTYSEYCFATSPERVVLRLRTEKADLDACWVCYGDRMDPDSPIQITRIPMSVKFSDSIFDYYETEFDPGVTRLCYYFELQKKDETLYYYNDTFHSEPHINRQLYYNFHYIRVEDMAHIPDWFRRAVVYQIYPDSFATSKGFISKCAHTCDMNGQTCESKNGGTLQGIRENLPYLQDLGITCIYMTPIFAAASWHKYDTIDYFQIDPCFGTKDEFRKLVNECHKRDMRVILDGVFNHCGAGFFAFQDLLRNGANSRYRDWFYVKNFPVKGGAKPNYECFAYVDFMPKLNTGNSEVAQYILDVGTYWIREFDIDGWRLDVANEIDHDFWRKYRKAIRREKEDVVLIGEIWDDSRSFLEGDQFDSVMNYNLTFAIVDAIARQEMSAKEFAERVSFLLMRYREPMQQAQMNLIDSHDVPRFLSQAGRSREKLKLAALFLLTHVGAPMVFYGDEQGIPGWHEIEYRQPMIWSSKDTELYAFYKELIRLRKKYMDSILVGYRIYYADKQVLVYGCENAGAGFLVVMNLCNEPQERMVSIPKGLQAIKVTPKDYFTAKCFPVQHDELHLTLKPWSYVVFPCEG